MSTLTSVVVEKSLTKNFHQKRGRTEGRTEGTDGRKDGRTDVKPVYPPTFSKRGYNNSINIAYGTKFCPLSFKRQLVKLCIKFENNKFPLSLMATSRK